MGFKMKDEKIVLPKGFIIVEGKPAKLSSGVGDIARSIIISTALPIVIDIISDMITQDNIEGVLDRLYELGETVTGNTSNEWDDKIWAAVAEKLLEPSFYSEYGVALLNIVIDYLSTVDNTYISSLLVVVEKLRDVLAEYENSETEAVALALSM